MPRFGKRVVISSSQEEVLEAISAWDDTQAAGVIDETPNQLAYAENYSQSSLERVFDVSGSSLCPGPSQQAVKLVSPTDMSPRPGTTWDVALEERDEEDNYNEAFESDRSQSPPRTVSWGLPAGSHGCKDGPKSPIISTRRAAVALEEGEKLPLSANLKLVSELDVSNRPMATPPEAAGVTIRMRAEVEVDQEAVAAEEDGEDKSGRRAGVATVREANGGGRGKTKTTADDELQQHVSSIGIGLVCPQGSSLLRSSPALKPTSLVGEDFGSGSASAFKRLGRTEKDSQQDSQLRGSQALKPSCLVGEDFGSGSSSDFKRLGRKENQKDSQPALSGEHNTPSGLEGETSVRIADIYVLLVDDTLDQIPNSGQVNAVQVIDELETVEDDHSGKEVKSGDKCERRRSRVSLLSPTPPKSLMDAANFRSADKTGVAPASAGATEGGGQCTPPSRPRPPRAVQEKLDRLRSQSQTKRAKKKSFNLLEERLRTERDMISSGTVLEAIKLRSGERPATNITAAGVLKTALDVGITLPPPFHRNYFSG